MKASNNLVKLIRLMEGFSARPYFCPAGVPTIGYGSTRYPDGTKVTIKDPPIDDEEAGKILLENLKEYEDAVNRYVLVPLKQYQFDALVDFAYNCGAQNLRTSMLLRLVNKRDFAGAAMEFEKWVYGNGKKLPGLARRREAERKLFKGE